MVKVRITATGARPKEDGDTAGEMTGLPQIVVVVVKVAATGEPVEGTEMEGVPP